MVWEIAAVIMGTMVLIHALYLDRKYTARIRRLDISVVGIEDEVWENSQDNNSEERPESKMFDHIWAITTIKTQRSGSRRMIVIDTICFIGIVFLGSLNPPTITSMIFFILCPAPAYLLVYHFNNVSDRFVKRK